MQFSGRFVCFRFFLNFVATGLSVSLSITPHKCLLSSIINSDSFPSFQILEFIYVAFPTACDVGSNVEPLSTAGCVSELSLAPVWGFLYSTITMVLEGSYL